MNDYEENDEAISVSVRVRPLNGKETKAKSKNVWQVLEGTRLYSTVDPNMQPHTFDNVFDTNATTLDVYDKVARGLVSSVLSGMNGTVFAYGQTASGKTFTMQGSDSSPGILTLAADQIFNEMNDMPHFSFLLHVSYIEVYCEQVKDLLSDSNTSLRIREDRRGFFVDNLSSRCITSVDELLQVKEEGERRRHIGETDMNLKSSRSHTIFTLKVQMRDKRVEECENTENRNISNLNKGKLSGSSEDLKFGMLVGALNIVDLAGSENARATGAEGDRLKEGGNINKSLLTLSRVISQLANGKGKSVGFVNWRDSKLTQILQPALAGNCRTAVVCCVTPAQKYLEETKSTLNFASRAKQIHTHATVNEILDNEGEIRKLRLTVETLRQQLAHAQSTSVVDNELKKKKLEMIESWLASDRMHEANVHHDTNTPKVTKRRKKTKRGTWCPGDKVSPPSRVTRSRAKKSAEHITIEEVDVDTKNEICTEISNAEQKKMQDLQDTLAQKEASISALSDQVHELENQVEHVNMEKDAAVETLEDSQRRHRKELDELNDSVAQLKAKLDSTMDEFTSQKELKAELESQLTAKQVKVADLEHKIRQMDEDQESLLESFRESTLQLHQKIESSKAEIDSIVEKYSKLESELEEERLRSKEFQDEKHETVTRSLNQNKDVLLLNEQLSEEISALRARELELQETVSRTENVLVSLELANEKLSGEVKKKDDVIAGHSAQLEDLKKNLESSKIRELELAISEKDVRIAELVVAGDARRLHEDEKILETCLSNMISQVEESEEVAKLKGKIAEKKEKMELLESQLCNYELQLAETQKMLEISQKVEETLEEKCSMMEAELVDAQNLVASSKNTEVILEEKCFNAEKQLDDVQKALVEKEAKLEFSNNAATRLTDRVNDLESQINTLLNNDLARKKAHEDELAQRDEIIASMKEQVSTLENQLRVATQPALGGSVEDLDMFKKKANQLQVRLDLSMQELEQSQGKCNALETECEELRASLEVAQKQFEESRSANSKQEATLNEKYALMEKDLDAAQRNVVNLETSLKNTIEQHTFQSSKQLETIEKLEESLNAARVAASSELDSAVENMKTSIEALEQKNRSLKESLTERDDMIVSLNEANTELQQKVEELEAQYANVSQGSDNLVELQGMLSSLEEQLKTTKSDAKKAIAAHKDEIEEASRRLQRQKDSTTAMEKELQSLVEEIEKMKESEARLSTTNEELRNQVLQLSDELTDTQFKSEESRRCQFEQLAEMQRWVESKEKDCDALHQECIDSSTKIKKLEAEISRGDVARQRSIILDLQSKVEEYQSLLASRDELIEKGKARIAKLEKVKLTKEYAQSVQELKQEHRKLKVEHAELKSAKEALAMKLRELKDDGLTEKAHSLARKWGIVDCSNPGRLLDIFSDNLDIVRKELRSKTSELAEVEEAMSKRLSKLIDQLQTLKDENTVLETGLNEAHEEAARYSTVVAEQRQQIDQLRASFAHQDRDQAAQIKYLEKENLDLLTENRKLRDKSVKSTTMNHGSARKTPLKHVEVNTAQNHVASSTPSKPALAPVGLDDNQENCKNQ